MDLELTKMELIEMLLNTSKKDILLKIKRILEEEQTQLSGYDYQVIQKRKDNHENGYSKSFSWEEVKQEVLKG